MPDPGADDAAVSHIEVRVDPANDGMRVDRVLAAHLDRSRSAVARMLGAGLVTRDGTTLGRSTPVHAGEVLVVVPAPVTADSPPPPMPTILHQDVHVWVIDKPAGLVVHPGHGNPDGTLADALAAAGITSGDDPGRPGIVHRLDRDTSGAMAIAASDAAHGPLTEAIAARRVTRLYLALVHGRLPGPHGVIDVPLGRDPGERTRFAARVDGRPAVTDFRVVAEGSVGDRHRRLPVQLVACRLRTGRTHQIRVHLAHAGCPVVGDSVYGGTVAVAEALGVQRMWLHATRLAFDHPLLEAQVDVVAPVPPELAAALALAGIDLPHDLRHDVPWP